MFRLPPVATAVLLAVWLAAPAVRLAANQGLSKQQADSMLQKLALITLNGQSDAGSPRLTPVSETEVNAFLVHHAADRIPEGVVDPRVAILGDGRLSGRAIVDLDAVRRRRSGDWLDPLSYLSGRLPVAATGVLRTRNGIGRLEIETAEVAGVSVPKTVLQELVTYYSRTSDDPDGVNLDAPFELPVRIREIRVDKGQAVVVQ